MPCNCVRSPSLREARTALQSNGLALCCSSCLLSLRQPNLCLCGQVSRRGAWVGCWVDLLQRARGLRGSHRAEQHYSENRCVRRRATWLPVQRHSLALPDPSRAPGPPREQSGLSCDGRSCCSSRPCTHVVTPQVLTLINKAQSKEDRCQLSVTAVLREPQGKLDICAESH